MISVHTLPLTGSPRRWNRAHQPELGLPTGRQRRRGYAACSPPRRNSPQLALSAGGLLLGLLMLLLAMRTVHPKSADATVRHNQPPPPATPATDTQTINPQRMKGHDDLIQVTVMDLIRATKDPARRQQLEGKAVQLIGRLHPTHDPLRSSFQLIYTAPECCGGEARKHAANIEGIAPPQAPELSWLQVTGTAHFTNQDDGYVSSVQALKVEPLEPAAAINDH